MLTIRINDTIDEKIAYLRLHKVKFTPVLREAIDRELTKLCDDFKMKEKRIKGAPDWYYK
jgi:hypothetical protein